MKLSLIKVSAAALLCVASATSMAAAPAPIGQEHGHGHGYDHRGDDHHDDHGHPPPPGHYHGMHDRGRHEGWYRQGGHVPDEYRHGTYVVTDWHAHRGLREPPRGYEYVRSDNGDFLLVAIATGVIASIIAGN